MTTNDESSSLESMERILQEMLEADEDITARAVGRRHTHFRHPSLITRHAGRSVLLAKYQASQAERRAWGGRVRKSSAVAAAAALAGKDEQIAELKRQIEVLSVAVLGLIRCVGELGGMRMWRRLFEGYQQVPDELKRMGLWPAADVKAISTGEKQ